MDVTSDVCQTTINMKSGGIERDMAQADRILLRSSPSIDTGPEMGLLLGHALAMDHSRVVVGRDLMRSSSMMKEALVSGLRFSTSEWSAAPHSHSPHHRATARCTSPSTAGTA